VNVKPFQTPAPKPADADVPLETVQALVARQRAKARVEESAAKLRWLLAHPDEAPHTPATSGVLAEYRHLLYDADPDASVPAFPYPAMPKETN